MLFPVCFSFSVLRDCGSRQDQAQDYQDGEQLFHGN